MNRRLCTLLLCLLGALVLVGCGARERKADVAARDGILLYGNGAEPKGLDPHLVTGVTENKIISALFEGLINYHPTDDNLPEPGVAETWEPSNGYRTWTFHLREDAVWSNGDPVTAHDFVYSFRRMLTPDLGAEYADMLYLLENGQAFHQGEIDDFGEVGVKALDDKTLQVDLVGPTPYFLSVLKHYSWYPVNPRVIEEFGGMTARGTAWTRPGNLVGNGPFTLAEWKTNEIIKVVKSETYWDRDKLSLNEIHFFPIENQSTEETAFLNGELHVTNGLKSDMIPSYRRNRADVLLMDPYLGTYFYRFNISDQGPEVLKDIRVRRALNLAVDRASIVNNVTMGDQVPAGGYIPHDMGEYESQDVLRYDPAEARRLFAAAGYPDGEGFPVLEIIYNTQEDHRKIAQAIQQMWQSALGIDVAILNQEWKVYLDTQSNLEYDVARAGWIGDFMDPFTFLNMWITDGGNNDTGWSNAEYDRLLRASKLEEDPRERLRILKRMEDILLEELPILPIYYYTRIRLKDPRLAGWYPKLLDNRPYKYLYFDLAEN